VKVLVCGDRNWTDEATVHWWLDLVTNNVAQIEVIEGCARGADKFAESWWRRHAWSITGRFTIRHFPANWNKYGMAAGPLRNRDMLAYGPDLVLAFHNDLNNSKGTKDMVMRARAAGVPVAVIGG